MLFVFIFLIALACNIHGQEKMDVSAFIHKGVNQTELIKGHRFLKQLPTSEKEVIKAIYWHTDTTKVFIVSEQIHNFDPTNNIREDEHNKVNFITFRAFDSKPEAKYTMSVIVAAYDTIYGIERWYTEVRKSAEYFTIEGDEVIKDFISKVIDLSSIDFDQLELRPDYWTSGRFSPTPEIVLSEGQDSYGNEELKKRYDLWRPFTGRPILIRDFYLDSATLE